MKIQSSNIDLFINNPYDNVKSILIYGPNTGLINQRFNSLKKNFLSDNISPFAFIDLDFEYIKDNIRFLKEELYSLNFMTPKKLLKIHSISPSISKEMIEILVNYKGVNKIIVTAGELKVNSTTRKFFENHTDMIAMACYEEEISDIKNFILKNLAEEKYEITKDALCILTENVTLDREIIIKELQNIKRYSSECKKIDSEIIYKCIEDLPQVTIEKFTQELMLKNLNSLKYFKYLLKENVEIIIIIKTLVKLIEKLLHILKYVEEGQNSNDVIKNFSPVIFFKQVSFFRNCIVLWKSKELIIVISSLTEIEKHLKKNYIISKKLFEKFIIEIIYKSSKINI